MPGLLDGTASGVEAIFELALQGRPKQIEAMLERFSPGQRVNDPRAIMLRAMRSVLGGDAPNGIKLLQRAAARGGEPAHSYVIDLLVPLLITSSKVDEAEAVLDRGSEAVRELSPGFIALRAVLAACRGDTHLSRRLAADAISQSFDNDSDLLRGHVLQRCSLAAFYRGEYNEAHERSIEAARLYESCESFRSAAIAYSVPYVIAHTWFGDAAMARVYASRVVENGHRAEDLSWINYGLVAQLDLAAETGNRRELGTIRARLLAQPLHEQYGERFSLVQTRALADGWAGRFDAARGALVELRAADGISLARRALCDALIGLCAAAMWNLPEARRLARPVLSQTAGKTVLPSDAHLRRAARIVAAATCSILGDMTRARRALSRDVDPSGAFVRFIAAQEVDELYVPIMLRGYARMINVAAKVAAANRPVARLTAAELIVLRALPDGTTLAAIASQLGKSPETVKKQVHSIYAKLDASNRTQAIRRARSLQVI